MWVLLVEDEFLIREIMAESLEDAGYEVFEAADGHEATEAIHTSGRTFSIVVTDVQMPGGIDGFQVAAEARAVMPSIPVVIASGRPDALKASWMTEPGVRLLRKPYMPSALVDIVRALVDPSRARQP